MYTVLTYFVSLIVIVMSVFITLLVKNELEQLFRHTPAAVPFHICNIAITLMVSLIAHTVVTVYIIGNEVHYLIQALILLLMTLSIYFLGHLAFEKYKSVYRKFTPAENGKVMVLNEKYVKKKKPFSKLKKYNAISKEK